MRASLALSQVGDDQEIVVRPALQLSRERGVYCAPVGWTGQRMMLCLTQERLQQEFVQALATGDITAAFDPETYRGRVGLGIYLDYYQYSPLEPGEKSQRNYANGIGICYRSLEGEPYTSADFDRLTNGEAPLAQRLFDLCDGQAPEFVWEDALRQGLFPVPVFSFAPEREQCSLLFLMEQEAGHDQERKWVLLRKAGWQKRSEGCWTHAGKTMVPQGVAYMEKELQETVSIAPTPAGCRAMKVLFQESIASYQEQLGFLDSLLSAVQSHSFGEMTGGVHALFEEMSEEKRASLADAVLHLEEGIAELEQCGY